MNTYCTYLRVSTQRQGAQGLGIAAQRNMCENFIKQNKGKQVQEFMDVESGTHRDRKGLWQAIDYCKKNGCSLVIAKLDRMSRDVEFTFKVINTGIDIHFTDMPVLNSMILGVFAAVAQYEREMVSTRTKQALAVKKSRGVKLGAASDSYLISKEKASERAYKAGATRARRLLENRDTKAFIAIMKRVFPKCAETPEEQWKYSFVSVNKETRERFLSLMKDYKELDLDGRLFAKWDLSDIESPELAGKLASKFQSLIKMLNRLQKENAL